MSSLTTTTTTTTTPVSAYLTHYNFHPTFLANYIIGEELGSGGFGFVVSARERKTGIERAVKFIFRNKVPAHCWVKDRDLGAIPMEIYILKNVKHSSIIGYVDSYQDEHFCYLVMELHGTQWSLNDDDDDEEVEEDDDMESPRSPALSETSSHGSYCSSSTLDSPIDEYPPMSVPTHHKNDFFNTVLIQEEEEPQQPVTIKRRTSCDLFECIERHNNFEEPLARMIFKQIASCVAHLDMIGVCHRDIKDENIVIDDQFQVR